MPPGHEGDDAGDDDLDQEDHEGEDDDDDGVEHEDEDKLKITTIKRNSITATMKV